MRNKGVAAVLLSYVLWGLFPIFWKLLADMDAVYILCCRILFSLAVSVLVVAAAGRLRASLALLRQRRTLLAMLACGVTVSINWGGFIYCVTSGHVLDASLAYYVNPIVAVLLGFFVFRERLGRAQWCAVALAAAGVSAQIVMEGRFPWLALLIALTFALYGAVKKKADLPGEVSMLLETLLVAPVALAALAYMELRGGPLSTGQLAGWRLLLLPAAGLVTYLPLALYSAGIRDTDLSLAGILMYVNPTMQLLCGLVLYGEEMSAGMLVTFVCVWCAILIYTLGGRLAQKRAAAKQTEV